MARGDTPTPSMSSASSPTRSFCTALMEENISLAEEILSHWDRSSSSSSSESLHRLLQTIGNLHRARQYFFKDTSKDSSFLVRSQTLMDEASKHLQIEFHRILSSQRDLFGGNSLLSQSSSCISLSDLDINDDNPPPPFPSLSSSSSSTDDLRAIARCMVYCGHGKECIKVYRLVRNSAIEEGLYNLGFHRLTAAQLQKLPWETVERNILTWVAAAKNAVQVLFSGEHRLCSHTFPSSPLGDTLFGEIANLAASRFFAFPELVVTKIKLSPEKIFRLLDMHETMLELLPKIQSIFYQESTSQVREQVDSSLNKLGEAVRLLLDELETAIKKDNTKAVIPGGGLHPLARYVANFVSLLADYGPAMADIFSEPPPEIPPGSPLHAAAILSAPPSPTREAEEDGVSLRLGTLLFVLLCKLDSKAELYGDPALGYLFLANNLQYLVRKMQRGRLIEILGEEWAAKNEERARRYVKNYERLEWKEVMETLPEDPEELDAEAAAGRMRRFNVAFESACKRQAEWVIADRTMEHEVKLSISRALISAYRPLYVKCREEGGIRSIRFAPEDLANYVSDLFSDGRGSSVYSGHGSSGETPSRRGSLRA